MEVRYVLRPRVGALAVATMIACSGAQDARRTAPHLRSAACEHVRRTLPGCLPDDPPCERLLRGAAELVTDPDGPEARRFYGCVAGVRECAAVGSCKIRWIPGEEELREPEID